MQKINQKYINSIVKTALNEDLKIIKNVKGDILHVLKSNEKSFDGFGEAYFSSIK